MRALLGLCVLALSGCTVELLGELDEEQANAAAVALERAGIDARKQAAAGGRGRHSVAVPRGELLRAWEVLRRQGLPRRAPRGLAEVFGKGGLLPSAGQQQAMMREALGGELVRTLQSVEGVLEARVHLVPAEPEPLSPGPAAPEARASVLLRVTPSCSLTRADVQRLVAGAVHRLAPAAVSVVRVVQRPAAGAEPAPPLVALGPLRVSSGSRGRWLGALAGSSMLLLALGLVVALLWRRNQRLAAALVQLRRQQREPRSDKDAADLESSLSLLGRSFSERSRPQPPPG